MLDAIRLFLVASIGFALLYGCASFLLLRTYVRRGGNRAEPRLDPPSVTILKPMKGIDDELEQNLDTFFRLDYPAYELLFGINDANDPAIPVIERVRARHVHVPSRLVISEVRVGLNPKINNLVNMLPHARHELLLISDSNVRVRPDYLTEMVREIGKPNVGLVTSTIRGVGDSTLGAVLENLHLNGFVAGSVFAVRRLFGKSVTIGKSMLFRRQTIEALGGLEVFADVLAEDYLLGQSIIELGYRVETSGHIIDSIGTRWSLKRFTNRHVRWGIMRRHISLPEYIAEYLAFPCVLATLLVLITSTAWAMALLFTSAVASICLSALASMVLDSRLPLRWHLIAPLKEFFMFGVWAVPFFKETIEWRGNRFIVTANTALTPAPLRYPSPVYKFLSRAVVIAVRKPVGAVRATRRYAADRTRRIVNRLTR